MQETKECELALSKLPKKALKSHKFPQLSGNSLLSVATFCAAGWKLSFTTEKVEIIQGDKVIT